MSEIITYSLRRDAKRSDGFYRDLSHFTDEVLVEAEGRLGRYVSLFVDSLGRDGEEPVRSRPEYLFELMTLGVLWRCYAGESTRLGGLPRMVLTGLSNLRRRNRRLRPALDPVRGWLAALFLFPTGSARAYPSPTVERLEQLLKWLAATGDFREEIKRLEAWQVFLEGQVENGQRQLLVSAVEMAGWLEERSREVLGAYTPNVDQFLVEKHPGYRWREDGIFCGRRRVEYHNNMVGAEIMNRAYRRSFLDADKKVVLLPPCMKAKPDEGCEAVMTPFGERCGHCTPGCRVHQVTKLGEKHGFDVFILPHELSIFSDGDVKPANGRSIGIVGVSCPLTITTGGWETRDLGVPAQGVLLDYCGCPWHWHDEGIMTDINLNRLLSTLDVETGKQRRAKTVQVN